MHGKTRLDTTATLAGLVAVTGILIGVAAHQGGGRPAPPPALVAGPGAAPSAGAAHPAPADPGPGGGPGADPERGASEPGASEPGASEHGAGTRARGRGPRAYHLAGRAGG